MIYISIRLSRNYFSYSQLEIETPDIKKFLRTGLQNFVCKFRLGFGAGTDTLHCKSKGTRKEVLIILLVNVCQHPAPNHFVYETYKCNIDNKKEEY